MFKNMIKKILEVMFLEIYKNNILLLLFNIKIIFFYFFENLIFSLAYQNN